MESLQMGECFWKILKWNPVFASVITAIIFAITFFEVLTFIDDVAGRQAIAFVAFFFSIGSVAVAGLFPVMPGRWMPSYREDTSLPTGYTPG